jgi:hypothetical protein
MKRRSLLVLGAAIALVLGLGAGTAFAFFTSSGSGSGTASTGSVESVTVLGATGMVTNKLYPGGTGDLKVEFDNPNDFAVTITTVSGNGTVTGSGGIGTCSTTGVSVPTRTGLSISVVSGSDATVLIPNGVSMDATSDSACQGATFSVPVTLTVVKG